jgi:hypothetical protein
VPNPAKGYGPTRFGPFPGFLWFTLLRGGLRKPKLQEVATFGDGATLDVPGSPRMILTPAIHRGAPRCTSRPSTRCSSVTRSPRTRSTTGARGPQVAPFTADRGQAVASLARLEGISADLVPPGHGDPWTEGIQEAVRQVCGAVGTARLTPTTQDRLLEGLILSAGLL